MPVQATPGTARAAPALRGDERPGGQARVRRRSGIARAPERALQIRRRPQRAAKRAGQVARARRYLPNGIQALLDRRQGAQGPA